MRLLLRPLPWFPRPAAGWVFLLTLLALTLTRAAQAQQGPGQDLRPATLQATPGWIDLPPEEWERGKNGPQSNFEFLLGTDPTPRNVGFFGQRLRRVMAARGPVPASAERALNRYRRQRALFLSERLLFATTLIAGGGAYIATDYKFDTPEYILGGVAAISLLSNVLVTRHTNRHLQDAVKAYQGELMPQRPTGLLPRLRPAFGGVAPMRGGGVGAVVGWRL